MDKTASNEKIVYAANLVKKFGNFEAVRGVSFAVLRGECFGLLGPNGAGKTSIVKMIYGFSPVSSGVLEVFGLTVSGSARDIKAKIGVVPQEDNLDPDLSVWENLMVYAGYFMIKKEKASSRAMEILDFMDLTEKTHTAVNNLSGGMKRRLTFGRALTNNPLLLILDEPTTGLDPYARHLLWQRLRRLKESGTTIMLTTHYLEEATQLCDRIIILDRGRIIEDGIPQELIDNHVGKQVLELGVAADSREKLLEGAGGLLRDRHLLGDNLLLFTDHGEDLSKYIKEKAGKLDIVLHFTKLRPSNLEDVFFKLTGKTLEGAPEQDIDSMEGEI